MVYTSIRSVDGNYMNINFRQADKSMGMFRFVMERCTDRYTILIQGLPQDMLDLVPDFHYAVDGHGLCNGVVCREPVDESFVIQLDRKEIAFVVRSAGRVIISYHLPNEPVSPHFPIEQTTACNVGRMLSYLKSGHGVAGGNIAELVEKNIFDGSMVDRGFIVV